MLPWGACGGSPSLSLLWPYVPVLTLVYDKIWLTFCLLGVQYCFSGGCSVVGVNMWLQDLHKPFPLQRPPSHPSLSFSLQNLFIFSDWPGCLLLPMNLHSLTLKHLFPQMHNWVLFPKWISPHHCLSRLPPRKLLFLTWATFRASPSVNQAPALSLFKSWHKRSHHVALVHDEGECWGISSGWHEISIPFACSLLCPWSCPYSTSFSHYCCQVRLIL